MNIKPTKTYCNNIRKKYDISPNSVITAEKLIEIGKIEWNLNIQILNSDSTPLTRVEYTPDIILMLIDKHYYRVVSEKNICDICGKQYINKHDKDACFRRKMYQKRVEMDKFDKEQRHLFADNLKIRYSKEDQYKDVEAVDRTLHYDIETYNKDMEEFIEKDKDINCAWRKMTPYILGCVYYNIFSDNYTYRVFEGEDCMDKFFNFLITSEDIPHIKYLNAFNGNNFDHLFLMSACERHPDYTIKDMNPLKSNGTLVTCTIDRFKTVDVGKHLGFGSLKEHLKSWGCEVQKGEFDHKKASTWETMSSELKKQCKEYLYCDVIGLQEISQELHYSLINEYGTTWLRFLTTPSLSWGLLTNTPIMRELIGECKIKLPKPERYEKCRLSTYGGRTQVNKRAFLSKNYKTEWSNENHVFTTEEYEKVDDYLVDLDANSLYPAAMMEWYPTGDMVLTNKFIPDKLGIYHIKFTPNTGLLTPVLPRKEDKKLIWDLKDSEGWYTSVDIQSAIDRGYKIEVLTGFYWTEKARVFKDYIDMLYDKKRNAKKKSTQYRLAKLMMNSVYGKTLQKAHFEETFYITEQSHWFSIYKNHDITHIDVESSSSTTIVKGKQRDVFVKYKSIKKPLQFGIFVLAYSRKIMLEHMETLNPNNTMENLFYYTDTDSLVTHVKCLNNDVRTDDSKLGYLSNDLSPTAKIIRAIFIAPKMYMLEYLTEKEGKIIRKFHITGKGVKKGLLNPKDFEIMKDGVKDKDGKLVKTVKKEMPQFKKKWFSLCGKDRNRGVEQMSLYYVLVEKSINKKPWSGRDFYGLEDEPQNVSYPYGYDFTI